MAGGESSSRDDSAAPHESIRWPANDSNRRAVVRVAAGSDNCQGIHRTGGHTHSAAGAAVRVDLRAALMGGGDGLIGAGVTAGHADHILPGDTGLAVELRLTRYGKVSGGGIDFQRAGLHAGHAESAAATAEVDVGDACLYVVCRVQADNLRFAGIRAGMRAAKAVLGQWQMLVPGRGWPQRVLPFIFTVTASAGQ